MGVTGLWKLIEPCGKEVPVDTLEGKVLAVDISIWLHQVVKGFQDSKGNALANAHLLGLFNRLCKLLYYRVRPVFVFDGCVPQLKRDTIARRQQQRGKLNLEAERIQQLLVHSLAKEKVVQEALGANAENLLKSSPLKRMAKAARAEDAVDDMFKLPELPSSSTAKGTEEEQQSETEGDTSHSSYTTDFTDDSSFDESNPRYNYDTNLQAIDVRSQHFRSLPVEVRHEILVDIKETRKHSWGRIHELPACSNEFSTFQMKRLLKRRAVQESLEEVQQEMGGKQLTYAELMELFTEEGIVEPTVAANLARPICSDENTRFLLVRDLKKKLTAESEAPSCSTTNAKVAVPASSKPLEKVMEEEVAEPPKKIEKKEEQQETLDKEYDIDLQLAMAMSLEDDDVYRPEDYEYESDKHLRLNSKQRQQLQKAAVGPARAYMIEYGGMNDDEVAGIMDATQVDLEQHIKDILEQSKPPETDDDVVLVSETAKHEVPLKASQPIQVDSDTDTDTDLEEVVESAAADNDSLQKADSKCNLEIVVDVKDQLPAEEDLFADIFEEKEEKREVKDSKYATIENAGEKRAESNAVMVLEASPELKAEQKPKDSNDDGPTAPPSTQAMADILAELKRQASDATQINLSDIEVNSAIIELSDDEQPLPTASGSQQVVEILRTPSKKEAQTRPSSAGKSPGFKSPSSKSILEYFETEYVIKRTPEKTDAKEENVPHVKSPFFVKRTPKSSDSKSVSPVATPSKKGVKVSKALFEDNPPTAAESTQASLEAAAEALKAQKTAAELQEIAGDLAQQRRQLETERNRQDRMGMSISQRMNAECQELLRLFGIPYIVAPMEAEAQCAFLDTISLTNGTITDDSDIWLFGGRTVYKNFFAANKHVLEFRSEKIEASLQCDRRRLIQLACLVGSDYTNGVHGIGTVTALEILASFTPVSKETPSEESNMRATIAAVISTLGRFRDWWQLHKASAAPPGSSVRLALCKKLKNIELDEGFPSLAVVEAYLQPTVDESKDAFSWGAPDVQSIREFAKKNFGWTSFKTDETLTPVLKKLNERKSQVSIKNYFAVKSARAAQEPLKVSKRVQSAITKLSGVPAEATEEQKKVTRRTQRKRPAAEGAPTKEKAQKRLEQTEAVNEADDALCSKPSTSKAAMAVIKKTPNIPNVIEVIPQREKTRAKLLQNKQKAAELFKKSSTNKP